MTTGFYKLHYDHTQWLNKLSFYSDEIRLLQTRLGKVNGKLICQNMRLEADHFYNQFLVQENTIHSIKQTIKQEEREIILDSMRNPLSLNVPKTGDRTEQRNRIERFEDNFNKLRKEYTAFLNKYF